MARAIKLSRVVTSSRQRGPPTQKASTCSLLQRHHPPPEQPDKDSDDGDHDEQFDQCEAAVFSGPEGQHGVTPRGRKGERLPAVWNGESEDLSGFGRRHAIGPVGGSWEQGGL
jgi:hypothetical protein